METKSVERKYYLDWLRVIAISTVFVFHSLRFFNLSDWHVKNAVTFVGVQHVIDFFDLWMMPFIFIISGASIFFALKKGGPGKFILDKVLRLVVPLVMCMFTHGMLQVYLEHISHGQFSGTILQFLPHYFTGIYGIGNGNFALVGMHLWYLAILFVFSVICLPLFWWLRRGKGGKVLEKLTGFLAKPGLVILLMLPLTAITMLGLERGIFGYSLGAYLFFLAAGFVLASNDKLLGSVQKLRWVWFGIALITTYVFLQFDEVRDSAAWFLCLTFLGFGMRYLNIKSTRLAYANEAVLPFYILHQTVLLVVGFFVVQWRMPAVAKWLVIAPVSFVLVMGIYELLVRRINALRFLFGMKVLRKKAVVPSQRVVPAVESGAGLERP